MQQSPEQEPRQNKKKEHDGYRKFDPTTTTKSYYLAVRKRNRTLGRVELPGLFGYEEGYDGLLTKAALTTEVIALLFLARVIKEGSPDIPFYMLIIGALAFIAFDITAAWGHHFSLQPRKCRIENQQLRVFPSMRAAGEDGLPYGDYRKLIRFAIPPWAKLISWGCLATIGILAIIKFLLYIANVGQYFYSTNMPPHLQYGINGLVFLAYLFSAYVHIFHTGYSLAHWKLEKAKRRDEARYSKAVDEDSRLQFQRKLYESESFSMERFVRDIDATEYSAYLNLLPNNEDDLKQQMAKGLQTEMLRNAKLIEKHHIIFNDKDDTYKVVACGLLYDDQLEAMVQNQETPLAKAAVALWGHYVQLKCLGEE